MDASERTLSRKRDVFYDPQGHAIQLCVAHELDPEQMSIQSTCLFLGFSLCDDHLVAAKELYNTSVKDKDRSTAGHLHYVSEQIILGGLK